MLGGHKRSGTPPTSPPCHFLMNKKANGHQSFSRNGGVLSWDIGFQPRQLAPWGHVAAMFSEGF